MYQDGNDCMFRIPPEITETVNMCGLLNDVCNGLGRRCVAYEQHTKESRQALQNAIEAKAREKQELATANIPKYTPLT